MADTHKEEYHATVRAGWYERQGERDLLGRVGKLSEAVPRRAWELMRFRGSHHNEREFGHGSHRHRSPFDPPAHESEGAVRTAEVARESLSRLLRGIIRVGTPPSLLRFSPHPSHLGLFHSRTVDPSTAVGPPPVHALDRPRCPGLELLPSEILAVGQPLPLRLTAASLASKVTLNPSSRPPLHPSPPGQGLHRHVLAL